MAGHPRSMLYFAATTAVAAMLWTAAPAVAVENTVPAGDAMAAPAQTTAPVEPSAPAQQTAAPAAAVPAEAAPAQTATLPTAAPARTTPSVVRRETPRVRRVASSNYGRRAPVHVAPTHANLECSGFWCGRQFVWMILGVGF
jgi:hypothetical protein